jgi:pimeloyl-ACP methyl ester carboxylesterase
VQSPRADKPLVRFDLSLNTASTAIRLFRAADASTLAHVQQPDSAAMQIGNARFRYNAEDSLTTGISRGEPALVGDLTLHSAFDITKRSERPEFLFEAFGQPVNTTLTFTVTVTYPRQTDSSGGTRTTSRSHDLALDLRSIEEFYTRMRIPYRHGDRDGRFTHFTPGTTDLPHFAAAQPLFTGKTGDMPFLSGNDTVVLVHGWNMTDGTQTSGPSSDWKKAFAETAFKRLYWQGFRGQFTAFDWPTFADTEGPIQDVDPWIIDHLYPGAMVELAFLNFTYNASEYQAFRSGRSLMTFLADKKATGPVHLLAHSMGNVVAAEALRQWTAAGNGQPLVSNYVAMQGALSAGAYGDDATDATGDDSSGYDYYRYWPDRWLGTERRYYMQGTDQAAGKWINMFNELDRATSAELAWVGNNRMKPRGGDIWTVQSATGSPTDQFIAYRVDRPEYGGRLLRSYVVNGLPSDEIDLKQWLVAPGPGQLPGPSAYEVLAFMSKASAKPIGTKVVDFFVRANGKNIDISDLGLGAPYVDEWPGHSFQFHFDAATTSQFWKRVVDETGMDTVSKPRSP